MKLSEELKNCLDSDICGKCQYGNSETILTCKGLLQAVYEKIKEMEERNTSERKFSRGNNEDQNIKCSECEYCEEFRKVGNTRSSFTCKHADKEYIRKYYQEHHIMKMEGFIGYGKPYSGSAPIKTSPAWCPKKKG